MQNLVEYIADSIGGGVGQNDKKVDKEVEAKLAQTIANVCNRKNFRFGNGYIMAFDGKAYQLLTDKEVESLVVEVLERKEVGSVYVVNSITAIRKHLERKITREYKPQKNLISFDNAILDMDTGMTFIHDERFETNIRMNYDYDPKAQCPLFMKFLREVLPNGEFVRTLQEFVGALFINRKQFKIENILFLIGTGQNGKGVFGEAVQNMLGPGNYTSFSVERLVRSADKASNIASMNGKLANICLDMSKGDVSGGDFKTIVSGEDIEARFQYGRSFKASELPLIIANVNEMPVTTDHTFGHHRRPLPIPFNVTISNENKDVELPAKLRAEVSGIFNWAFEGRKRFIRNEGKFTEGQGIRFEKEKIRVESNSVLQFLAVKEYSSKRSDGAREIFITNAEFYREYEEFCRNYGKKNMFERINMGKILSQEGFIPVRKANGRGYKVFEGGRQYAVVPELEVDVVDQAALNNNIPGDELDLPF